MSTTACDPERATELAASLHDIQAKVTAAAGSHNNAPTLVAVSKLKPASDIMGCYQAGHRDFGENYVNELVDKAAALPTDIRWHFIGTLQSNKAKALAGIPNLHVIQTLTSAKTASALDRQLPADRASPLNVMLQVNTSGEASKSGLSPLHVDDGDTSGSLEVVDLASHVVCSCQRLHLLGVMTIGAYESSTDDTKPNPDFEALRQTRDALQSALLERYGERKWGVDGKLLMSMGMSSDFEAAIEAGSDIVRVGTSIFGQRPKKQ
ncbi:hypothetical protein M408DRAFT_14013 [Serendipita vermifera MAFF 305830]|uniref:Pyridoxal phosphate homeostasis protein n=1 Tax=Serendipita vermifera MAFF 305830 TaxID=933852 RepID=A0A0C2XW99_SERVB|nr:hypothetical protein M408DRAFT_14013 [Serendipita vermifera MAFF 305830]